MKKIIAVLAFALLLTSCGSSASKGKSKSEATSVETSVTSLQREETETTAETTTTTALTTTTTTTTTETTTTTVTTTYPTIEPESDFYRGAGTEYEYLDFNAELPYEDSPVYTKGTIQEYIYDEYNPYIVLKVNSVTCYIDMSLWNTGESRRLEDVEAEIPAKTKDVTILGDFIDVVDKNPYILCRFIIVNDKEYNDDSFFREPPSDPQIDTVLFQNNGIKITYKGYTTGGTFGPEIKLLIENTSAKNYTVQIRNESIDGYMINTTFSCKVLSGKQANDEITIFKNSLEENGLNADEIKSFDFNFHCFNDDDWRDSFDTVPIHIDIIKTTW